MTLTEKKYWVNGHQVRGVNFHTISLSAFGYGIMFCFGSTYKGVFIPYFNTYKLIK